MATGVRPGYQGKMIIAMPELTTAVAELKPDNIDDILRGQLANADVFIRAAAAGAIADRPKDPDNVAALKAAFSVAFIKDKHEDDAMLAIMDALFKLDKEAAVGSLLVALNAPDYLVRKKAFELLADPGLPAKNPGLPTLVESARGKHKDQVLPYSPAYGTRLGQVLNTDVDYRRALMRKDGSVRAIVTTEKGPFTIEFDPEEAPLTVDNWVKLARAGYFNGLEVHRVVPNFVMQDGDPRGDGNGGPGWSIRCEINMLPYDRGAVGMALSGKDTGGSQWFVTHAPQPHLDGGYTVFGHVAEKDMNVVDSIVRGDRIISVKIIETNSPQSTQRTPRHK
jgi:cyclophilin family peptidyl-prolyl cis-trans isomerase